MSLLVTGSIGIDTVQTPFGLSENCLGGSAVYFSMAASFFTDVRFVGVVGDDSPFDLTETFKGRAVDLQGLERRKGSKTFRWAGSYEGAMNDAKTDAVELNVLAEAPPTIPDAFKDTPYVFLANTHPALQSQLLNQLNSPKLVVADTMNLWIENEQEALSKLLKKIDGLVLNETEARMFTQYDNLVVAGKAIVERGLKFVVIKKGEHGTLLLTDKQECFILPAYPTDKVNDPTGAGDSFAGGMMGQLAANNASPSDLTQLKKAIVYGTAAASLIIEEFSLDAWNNANLSTINDRVARLKTITEF